MKANSFHCLHCHVRTFQWEDDWPALWNNGKNSQTTNGSLSIGQHSFRTPFTKKSSIVVCSNQNVSIFLTVTPRGNRNPSQETGNGKGIGFENTQLLFKNTFRTKKERKITSNYRPLFTEPIHRETSFKIETVKSVKQSMKLNDWAVSIDQTEAYLHIPIHPQSRKCIKKG